MHLIYKRDKKMKNPDQASYQKIHEIAEEVLWAMKEGRNITECEKFFDFLQDEAPDREFLERITSKELFMRYCVKRAAVNKQQELHRLAESLNRYEQKKRFLRRLRLRLSSVAAIVVLGFLTWMVADHDAPSKVKPCVEDLQCVHPTLVLENGVQLDMQKISEELSGVPYEIRKVAPDRVAYSESATVNAQVIYNTLVIPAGYNYSVELADGSMVTLNAGSRLKYPVSGLGVSREVELEGEAYFKVAKSQIPFVVKMGNSFVKVYGTEFNACKDQTGDIEVVLVKGSVGFSAGNGEEVKLKPNQKCEYKLAGENIHVSDVEVQPYIAWKNNTFNYDKVPLDYFLKKIASWYGVQFKYDRELLENIQFYVSTKRDIALPDLLLMIEKSTNLNFIQEADKVFTIK